MYLASNLLIEQKLTFRAFGCEDELPENLLLTCGVFNRKMLAPFEE